MEGYRIILAFISIFRIKYLNKFQKINKVYKLKMKCEVEREARSRFARERSGEHLIFNL